MKLIAISVFVGILSGVVAALCGVGGGIIMVPFFEGLLHLNHKQAVATSLAVIIPTALVATVRNASASQSLVVWPVAVAATLGAVGAAWLAAGAMQSMSNDSLKRIFALLLIAVGAKMLLLDGRA
jgi:uncharacterized membrane protein YfcA